MTSARHVWEFGQTILADQPGRIAVIRIFMDESGTHDGSPVVSVAAYCGRPRTWQSFTKDWNDAKRPIRVYHAVDSANLRGEFKGWSREQRDDLNKRLLPVLSRHELIGYSVGLNLKDFDEYAVDKPHVRDMVGPPYAQCFQWVVENILWWHHDDAGLREPLAFVHEQNDYQMEALETFEYIRKRYPQIDMSLAFAPKSRYAPLQAADALAYEANKRLRDVERPVRKAVTAMDPTGERVTIVGFSRPNMQAFVDKVQLLADEIKTFGRPLSFLDE